jgi:hypothetical protein
MQVISLSVLTANLDYENPSAFVFGVVNANGSVAAHSKRVGFMDRLNVEMKQVHR